MVGDTWGGMVAQRRIGLTRRFTPIGSVPPAVVATSPTSSGEESPLVYPVVMTFLEDAIQVEYPSLGCSGLLRPLDVENGALRAREEITQGDCFQGVEVVLKRAAFSHLDAEFLIGGRLVARGSLVRTPQVP
jgi:hypothetical protein